MQSSLCHETSLGTITLVADEHGLRRILLPGTFEAQNVCSRDENDARISEQILIPTARQITQYLAGRRATFDLPLSFNTATPFRQKVWKMTLTIPYGQTMSYGELARNIGCPAGARAVGGALGANPLPLVIPCHRVIGANGKLTGFSAGPRIKHFLLELEGVKLAETGQERAKIPCN